MFNQEDMTEADVFATIMAECMLREGVEEITVLDLYRMCANSHKDKNEDRLESTLNVVTSILDGVASQRMRNIPDQSIELRLTQENMFPSEHAQNRTPD